MINNIRIAIEVSGTDVNHGFSKKKFEQSEASFLECFKIFVVQNRVKKDWGSALLEVLTIQ